MIGIGVIGALFNARLAGGLVERLSPDLVDRIQPEKLVDPLFRDGLVEELGPEVWAVAEPQVQTAVATAITDNFLLAAAIVLISVLAILRMKEIRLRSAELPPAVSIERPDPGPSEPPSRNVIEFSVLESTQSQPLNGLVDVLQIEMREQYAPQPPLDGALTQRQGQGSLRRSVIAAAMVGAGLGLAVSLLSPRYRNR